LVFLSREKIDALKKERDSQTGQDLNLGEVRKSLTASEKHGIFAM